MLLQVANYPSQLCAPGAHHLRKKAHVDSGTLTLLASEDWSPGSHWQPGDGGLQLWGREGQWLEVEVPQGSSSSLSGLIKQTTTVQHSGYDASYSYTRTNPVISFAVVSIILLQELCC